MSSPPEGKTRIGEFVALLALLTSLVALSIDAILPALPHIGAYYQLDNPNDSQWVVMALFAGLALGQPWYGPLSDSLGRKPVIYFGLGVFIAGSVIAIFAPSFEWLLFGRVLQGFGAASPKIVTMAMVRDRFEGAAMARVVSFIIAVFILVPALAPALGLGVMLLWQWRAIFVAFVLLSGLAYLWLWRRQEETLSVQDRLPLNFGRLKAGVIEACTHRITMGYTLIAGLSFGSFMGYLSSAQQIFSDIHGINESFPLYFALLSLSIGGASLFNGRFVARFGMKCLSASALIGVLLLSLGFLFWLWPSAGQPSLLAMMVYLLLVFFGFGVLFGNFNAMAMVPMGHIAGTAAAVVGSVSTFLSLGPGTLVGQGYNQTLYPLVLGFALCAALSLVLMWWIERGELFTPDSSSSAEET